MNKRKTILERVRWCLFESEFYSATALKHKKTGEIVTGSWHGEIYGKILDQHGHYEPDDWHEGFVRSDREPHHEDWFETREQSRKRFNSGESVRLGELGKLKGAKTMDDIEGEKWDLRK